ncbi:MAG: hypothetical protein QXP97_06450 [Desulfurococcus sp.]|uniref:hypothetical protein n=1 Tax=Desulfurococcus sp. TaxID=51678 RepID=UPI0031633B44
MSDKQPWWESIDPSKLSEDARYRILKYLDEKYDHKKILEETGLSRVTLWRLLEKKSRVKPEYVKPLLKLLAQEEFEKVVSARNRLRSMGILREDGSVDYSLALEILAIAKDDEYLRKNWGCRPSPTDRGPHRALRGR